MSTTRFSANFQKRYERTRDPLNAFFDWGLAELESRIDAQVARIGTSLYRRRSGVDTGSVEAQA